MKLPDSKLIKHQTKKLPEKIYTEGDETFRIVPVLRFDDQCGNGHNSFSITAGIDGRTPNGRWCEYAGGCLHDEIAQHYPEYAKYIKWHLCSTDGPLHYVNNTTYLAGDREGKEREFDAARAAAIWPEATDEQLSLPKVELEKLLLERLPALMEAFKRDMEELGFVY